MINHQTKRDFLGHRLGQRLALAAALSSVFAVLPAVAQGINPFAAAPPAAPASSSQVETKPILPAGPSPVDNKGTQSIQQPLPSSAPATTPTPAAAAAAAPSPFGGTQDKQAPSLAQTPNPGISLMFDNADIYDVLKVVLGDALKLDYVIDPSVQGRITLKSSGAVSMADIFSVLETALATSNVAIVKQDKIYRVTKDANAVREKLPSMGVGPASPVMQIIPVKFVQASQLANTIRSFLGPQAIVTNDPTSRYLIVADRASNLEKVVDMVATLDVDYLQQVQVRLIPVTNSDASDIAKDLDALFKTSGMFNWAGTDGTKVYFLPISRMNAVLVATSNDKLMGAAEQWIKRLDAEPKNGLESFVHIYSVANGNASHLADNFATTFWWCRKLDNRHEPQLRGRCRRNNSRTGRAGRCTSRWRSPGRPNHHDKQGQRACRWQCQWYGQRLGWFGAGHCGRNHQYFDHQGNSSRLRTNQESTGAN
jgi:general secretion pathway protein D